MAKLLLKGRIVEVRKVEEVGENKLKKQSIYFQEPNRLDEFGKHKSDGDIWEVQVIGDSVGKFNLKDDIEGRDAILSVYINSKMVKAKDKPVAFFIQATLSGIDLQ